MQLTPHDDAVTFTLLSYHESHIASCPPSECPITPILFESTKSKLERTSIAADKSFIGYCIHPINH